MIQVNQITRINDVAPVRHPPGLAFHAKLTLRLTRMLPVTRMIPPVALPPPPPAPPLCLLASVLVPARAGPAFTSSLSESLRAACAALGRPAAAGAVSAARRMGRLRGPAMRDSA